MEDVFYQYAELLEVIDGYPIYVIKTTGIEAECIFLKNNECSIYPTRPRVCRLYPFAVGPGSRGKDFEFYLCKDKEHHFGQGHTLVKEWMYQNFKQEDREVLKRDFAAVAEIGRLLRSLSSRSWERSLFLLLYYRYYNFDLRKPFIPQYDRNQRALIRELSELVKKG